MKRILTDISPWRAPALAMSLLTVVPLMTAGTAHARQTTREPARATAPLSDSFAGLSLPGATRIVDPVKVATATRMLNGSLAPKYHGERLEAIRLTTTQVLRPPARESRRPCGTRGGA